MGLLIHRFVQKHHVVDYLKWVGRRATNNTWIFVIHGRAVPLMRWAYRKPTTYQKPRCKIEAAVPKNGLPFNTSTATDVGRGRPENRFPPRSGPESGRIPPGSGPESVQNPRSHQETDSPDPPPDPRGGGETADRRVPIVRRCVQ